MIISSEYLMLEDYITAGVVNVYRTKKEAQAYAKSMGWNGYDVERVNRRFEIVWIVAQHFIGREQIATLLFDVYLVLTNKTEEKFGIQQRITVKVKKLVS